MLKLIVALGSNLVAILVTAHFVAGFQVTSDPIGLGIVVVLFAVANSLVLPILRMIFKPLIWLSLGILGVAMNAVLLYVVDKFSDGLTISGLGPLFLATIIIGVVNATIAYGAKVFETGK